MYCSQCGAPQIFLSDELQAEIAASARAYQERDAAATAAQPPQPPETDGPVPPPPPVRGWKSLRAMRAPGIGGPQQAWSVGVGYALLSAGIALGLGLVSLLMPPVSLLMLVWVVSAPMLTVGFFNGRSGVVPPSGSGFGARLGLLTGLLVTFCCGITFTLSLVLTRFVLHDAGTLDAQLAASFAQQRAIVLQRLGSGVQPTLNLFTFPEYRVGMLLAVVAVSALIYLFLSMIAGGVAGIMLRRRRS